MSGHNFSGWTDLELIMMQKQVRDSGEDKEFLDAILVEIRRRLAQLERGDKDGTGTET